MLPPPTSIAAGGGGGAGAGAGRPPPHGAEEAEPGLEVPVDHLQRNPQRPRLLDEPLAVTRLSDRCGRHRDHAVRARSISDRLEISQSLDRSVDRVRPEAVVVAEFPTEAERRARVFEHIEVLPRAESEHDHPRRVRSNVDDRERLIVLSRPPPRFHGPMLPHGGGRIASGRR